MDAIVSDFVPTFTLMHLPQSRLVEEKLQALFSRKKPRDFYDLYFMLRANLLKRDQRRALKKIPALLKDTDISFSKELKVFLPASHWPIIRDFKNTLLRETERYLQ
jgi:predicted nucleotidyltransferase component of viral defense system